MVALRTLLEREKINKLMALVMALLQSTEQITFVYSKEVLKETVTKLSLKGWTTAKKAKVERQTWQHKQEHGGVKNKIMSFMLKKKAVLFIF